MLRRLYSERCCPYCDYVNWASLSILLLISNNHTVEERRQAQTLPIHRKGLTLLPSENGWATPALIAVATNAGQQMGMQKMG